MGLIFLVVKLIVALAVVGIAVIVIYANFVVGTDKTEIDTKQKTPLKLLSINDKEAIFETEMLITNAGPELGTVSDCFARPFLPYQYFDKATVLADVECAEDRRSDHYFEALLVEKDEVARIIVTLHFLAKEGLTICEALKDMVDMDVAMYVNGSGRKELYIKTFFATFSGEEISKLVGGAEHDC